MSTMPHSEPVKLKPGQIPSTEAVALLPKRKTVNVILVHAMPNRENGRQLWSADYAAARIDKLGAFRPHGPIAPGYGVYVEDQNGDQFHLETSA